MMPAAPPLCRAGFVLVAARDQPLESPYRGDRGSGLIPDVPGRPPAQTLTRDFHSSLGLKAPLKGKSCG